MRTLTDLSKAPTAALSHESANARQEQAGRNKGDGPLARETESRELDEALRAVGHVPLPPYIAAKAALVMPASMKVQSST